MRIYPLVALFAVLSVMPLSPKAAMAQTETVTVTIYNQNRALINEVRKMSIPSGIRVVEFKDVAETIDPTSLQVRSLTSPDVFTVLDQNYEYDLINTQNLLNKYVGKKLKIILPDPRGVQGALIVRDATLLANTDRPIFRMDASGANSASDSGTEIYVGSYNAVLLQEIPEGLRPQPTLVWLVDNKGQEEQRIETSYLAGELNWKADYVLKVDRNNTNAALSGWVTLNNNSGKAFKGAQLKLVAGDVHQAPRRKAPPAADMRALAAPAQESMQQEDFFEYHLYSLGRPLDIGNRQTKQVSLLQSPSLNLEKKLLGRWDSYGYRSPAERGIQKQKLSVFLKFKNSSENGLGIPLPEGTVRAYQDSTDGTVIFIGEDHIDHTGKDVDVQLKMGEAFDVIVERRQTEYRKVSANTVRYAWELRIKNSKEASQRVELEEALAGDWKILDSNTKYEKVDARTVRFVLDAPPSGKGNDAVVTYQAETSL